jgi:hypothetical protein
LHSENLQNTLREKSKRIGFVLIAITTPIIFVFFLLVSHLRLIPERLILALSFAVLFTVLMAGMWWSSIKRSPLSVEISRGELKLLFKNGERIFRWSEIATINDGGVIILRDGGKLRLADTSKEILLRISGRFHQQRSIE